MAILSVLYPASRTKTFDHAYYDETHIPLVKEAFAATGLLGVLVLKGVSSADGGPAPFVAMAHLSFESPEAMQASFAGPRSAEVMADIARFTKIKPVMQISTRVAPAATPTPPSSRGGAAPGRADPGTQQLHDQVGAPETLR